MSWKRMQKILMVLVGGGMLLQTASCTQTLVPLVANIVGSLVLESLLGGIAT